MINPARLNQALSIALRAHAGQVRKGTRIPYISHPMAVCALALEFGADEDQAAAALLHDAIEDGGAMYIPIIRDGLGERVLNLVQGCTDGVPNAHGVKPPWKERKLAYLAHLQESPEDILLISGSDKLHNARAIVADLQRIGTAVFQRFNAPMADTLWYYASLADIFIQRQMPMADSLEREVQHMFALSNTPIALSVH